MKKIVLLFSLILIAQSANAFVDNQYMKTEQYLVNTGYSKEMGVYGSMTHENPYREQYVESKSPVALLKRVHRYLVPGQNSDLDFHNHSGSFDDWSWKDF